MPVFDLVSMGVNPQFIKFDCTTMESDRFVCVREQAPDGQSGLISIFNTSMPHQPTKRPISAESAIVNPVGDVIALKTGTGMQILNIATGSVMKEHNMPEPVVFWKWISPSILALVTANAVFHWTMDGDSAPTKVFDRHASLAACEIINYKADDKISWCCLTGISKTPDGRIDGSMQMFSIELQTPIIIKGHACAFVDITLAGNTAPSTLCAYANRGAAESSINIIEVSKAVGPPANPPAVFGKKKLPLNFPPEAAGDFPLSMSISSKYGIVVVVTKLGYVHAFETETGACIYAKRFTESPVFTGCSNSLGGIHCINGKGQIFAIGIDVPNIIPFLVQGGNQQGAIPTAANSLGGGGDARLAPPPPSNTPSPLLQYFHQQLEQHADGANCVMHLAKLTPLQSVDLARLALSQGRCHLLQQWFAESRLEASEELGDFLQQSHTTDTCKLALDIYLACNAHDKGIQCFLALGMISELLQHCKSVAYTPDWISILSDAIVRNSAMAQQLAVLLFNNDGQGGPLCDPQAVVKLFFPSNCIQQSTVSTADAAKSLQSIYPEFLFTFFGNLLPTYGLLCLGALLDCDHEHTNVQLVVEIATAHVTTLGVLPLVQLFVNAECEAGLYTFISAIAKTSSDPQVQFSYLLVCHRRGINTRQFQALVSKSAIKVTHVAALVAVFDEHDELQMLQPWLEAQMRAGDQYEALHNALVKIYIDTGQDAKPFLLTSCFYNPLVVGEYCEKQHPAYSVICYMRGHCDARLIAVTTANGWYGDQAKYLIQRKNQGLWAEVLRSGNPPVMQLVSLVVGQIETEDEVEATVTAFQSANMPSALIELLEKIVLQGSEFGQNKYLQDLLIITAINTDTARVMGYITSLEKFDASVIAESCVQKELFESALYIYQRSNMFVPAINVLVDKIKDLNRGLQFAKSITDPAVYPEVWGRLARAQLRASSIDLALQSYKMAGEDLELLCDSVTAPLHQQIEKLIQAREEAAAAAAVAAKAAEVAAAAAAEESEKNFEQRRRDVLKKLLRDEVTRRGLDMSMVRRVTCDV